LRSLEIDYENDYQGCYYDRIPFDMGEVIYVNPTNMSNKICQEVCRNYGYTFSSTYNGYNCSCGNLFGSYTKANNSQSCYLNCSGNKSEICGGSTYRSVGVFYSDPGEIKI
jgi:hypothetical protein